MIRLPRLYAIVDSSCFPDSRSLLEFVNELISGGVTLLQYRNKTDSARVILEQSREIKQLAGHDAKLIMNDRADLCLSARYDGVHVGQDDLSADSVRALVGDDRWLGVSTHNPMQIVEADKTSANYLATGPVFATASKERPDPVVGIEGIRIARSLTAKPLVAIGGITHDNAASIIQAGADSVAVISSLLRSPRKSAEEFFRILR